MTELGVEARPAPACESTSDEALATQASDDRQAFAELYRRYVDPVYRYMVYQAPVEEAKDLTAQVFFHAYRASGQFRADSSYRAWLFRIAHNTLVSWRRGRGRLPVPLGEIPDGPDATPDAAARAAEAETHETVRALVAELAPEERELVELRYLEDLSPREIAHVTGRTPGAVRVRLHRLLRRLRHRLEERGHRLEEGGMEG